MTPPAAKRRASRRGNSHGDLTRAEIERMLAEAAYQRALRSRPPSH
jgi:hypothetical protein